MKKFFQIFAALATLGVFGLAFSADATIQTACPGNICAHSAVVGGHNVDWFWTQNQKTSASSIKVRFRTPAFIAGGGTVRFKVYVDKPFSSYASLKNPDPATTLPPTQNVAVTNLWIERTITNPAVGTVIDFVQDLRYDSLPLGQVDLTIEIAQYGSVSTFNIGDVPLQRVEFDATAPTNRNEGDLFPTPPYPGGYLNCYDGKDNDFDYRTDCADADCADKSIGGLNKCESPESTCKDGLDNDGNGKIDCADPVCNGKPGNPAGDKFCGAENGGLLHANCADGFDNDGNTKIDCRDDVGGTGCAQTGFQDCAISETIPSASDAGKTPDQLCTDNIDNDRNGLIDGQDPACSCVLHPTPGDTPEVCSMKRRISINERLRWDVGSGFFLDDQAQCFDGNDNDLDVLKDCADPDCLGAASGGNSCAVDEAWLPPQPLDPAGVTSPSFYFNYCNDGIDNNGNGLADGLDPACKNVFGECSPAGAVGLASTENISFLSCTDNLDNDLNAAIDCADNACQANVKLGRAGCAISECGGYTDYAHTDAAACAVTENTPAMCGDGFDNNADGAADCADSSCTGVRHGAAVFPGYICGVETGATECSDGYDNDGNGNIDCLDAGCQNGVECAQRNWTLSGACVSVPHATTLAPIVAGGSVEYAHDDRLHVSDPYGVRFTGSGTYSSLTLVVGDAVNASNGFPFDATTCVLSGTEAGSMTYVSTDPRVGSIVLNSGATIADGFDVTLACAGSATVIPPTSYSLAVVANHGGTVEYGEANPTVQVFENVPPVLSPDAPAPTPDPAIDVEGVVAPGRINVPMGGTVRFQAKPGDVAPSSGICGCQFDLNGTGAVSPDGNCLVSQTFANDAPAFQIAASALDGASNRSATSSAQTVDINVVPSVTDNMIVYGSATTFRSGDQIGFSSSFQTDSASTFPGPCQLSVYDTSLIAGGYAIVNWDLNPTGLMTMTCSGQYVIPGSLGSGRWNLVVQTTDSSGDTVRSNVQTFLKCETADVGSGDCKDADFDNDGVPEGRYTPSTNGASPAGPTYPGPVPRSCDNCIGEPTASYNPNQSDTNGNGIGNACEATLVGRCEYRYCATDPLDPSPGDPCSDEAQCAPSGKHCIAIDQPMCTVNCKVDTDCSKPTAPIDGGVCNFNWGICKTDGVDADAGNCCFENDNCSSGKCDFLVKPFLQTLNGQVYATGGVVQGSDVPPVTNATFCVASAGAIINFTSAYGCSLQNVPGAQAPTAANNYSGSFGMLDVNGILNGKYGPVTNGGVISNPLNGQIILFNSGLTINSPTTFSNAVDPNERGNGLIVVKGDLVINADVDEQDNNVTDLKQLASVGWVVLKNGGVGGNVTISGDVNRFVGAVFAEGLIDTGTSSTQLKVNGAWIAKDYAFNRTYSSRTQGAEVVTFDPRLVMNPPPGMTDVTRSLPGFKAVQAQ